MVLLSRLAAAVLLLVALAAPAVAAPVTAAQYFALVVRTESFDAAMKASDMAAVMGVVPPKVLDKIAANFSITTAQLIEAAQQQMNEALKSVTFVSFSMDVQNATFFETADGTPFALIPTETVMDLGAAAGGKVKASSSTLGLLDGETWYLVRVEDAQQVAILKEVYPAFVNVDFPAGSLEAVAE